MILNNHLIEIILLSQNFVAFWLIYYEILFFPNLFMRFSPWIARNFDIRIIHHFRIWKTAWSFSKDWAKMGQFKKGVTARTHRAITTKNLKKTRIRKDIMKKAQLFQSQLLQSILDSMRQIRKHLNWFITIQKLIEAHSNL